MTFLDSCSLPSPIKFLSIYGLCLGLNLHVSAAELIANTGNDSGVDVYNLDYFNSSNTWKTRMNGYTLGWIHNPFNFSGSPYPWEKENQYAYSIDVDVFQGKNRERASFDGMRAFGSYWQKINPKVFFQLGVGYHQLRGIDSTPVVGGQVGYKPLENLSISARISDDFAYQVGFQPGATREALRRTVYDFNIQYDPTKTLKVPVKIKQMQFSDTNRMSDVSIGAMSAIHQGRNELWAGIRYFYEGARSSSKINDLGYFSPIKFVRWSLDMESFFQLGKNLGTAVDASFGKVSQLNNPSSQDLSVSAALNWGRRDSQLLAVDLSYRKYQRDLENFEENKIALSLLKKF